jgi:hypothetical protein
MGERGQFAMKHEQEIALLGKRIWYFENKGHEDVNENPKYNTNCWERERPLGKENLLYQVAMHKETLVS